jgi:hypothetical protein
VIRNLKIAAREAIRKPGGDVNRTMNGKQRLAAGQMEMAARTVLGRERLKLNRLSSDECAVVEMNWKNQGVKTLGQPTP